MQSHHHHHPHDYGYGAGPGGYSPQPGYGPWMPPAPPQAIPPEKGRDEETRRFVKGVLLGAAATYLLTNDRVQHTLFRAVAKVWTGVRFGMEEVRERYQDAQAEVETERRG